MGNLLGWPLTKVLADSKKVKFFLSYSFINVKWVFIKQLTQQLSIQYLIEDFKRRTNQEWIAFMQNTRRKCHSNSEMHKLNKNKCLNLSSLHRTHRFNRHKYSSLHLNNIHQDTEVQYNNNHLNNSLSKINFRISQFRVFFFLNKIKFKDQSQIGTKTMNFQKASILSCPNQNLRNRVSGAS